MTKGQRTVSGLLAAVVVLLGLNLIVKTSPAAVGEQAGPQRPVPVSIDAEEGIGPTGQGTHRWYVFRLWSDGAVDWTLVTDGAPALWS